MSCSRAIRELLWLSRFGELGPSSQPHLDHLAGCVACRDEIGFDRAMVQQLREALAERVAVGEPSPRAWEMILERAQAPEPRRGWLQQWSAFVVGRFRFAGAMAGTGLAVILALNMEIVSVPMPEPDTSGRVEVTALQQVPRQPTGRTSLVPYLRQSAEASAGASRSDSDSLLRPAPAAPPTRAASEVAEPGEDEGGVTLRVVFRVQQTPEPAAPAQRAESVVLEASDTPPDSQAGVPS